MLDQAAGDIVRKARSACAASTEKKTSNGYQRGRSLLEQMLRATKTEKSANTVPSRNQLSEQELCEEIASFVVAGHETTSTWCMWALYALALDPELQEKVYDDICQHVASDDTSEPIRLDDVTNMDYFQALLKEVLRVYTPVGMLFRYTKGHTIPPDTRLCIPIHLLHRHPDYWDRPNEFNPF